MAWHLVKLEKYNRPRDGGSMADHLRVEEIAQPDERAGERNGQSQLVHHPIDIHLFNLAVNKHCNHNPNRPAVARQALKTGEFKLGRKTEREQNLSGILGIVVKLVKQTMSQSSTQYRRKNDVDKQYVELFGEHIFLFEYPFQ